MKIVIPGNPISTNALYRGRRFLTKEGEAIKYAYAATAYQQYKGKPLEGNVAVFIGVRFPDNRRRDLDNVLKALLDSFTGILWADDSQIDDLQIYRKTEGEVGVEITAHEIK